MPNSDHAPVRRTPGALAAALAGLVAAGVALAAGELAAAVLGSGPTLITAIGTEFIDRFAAALKDIAVALFGTNDKAALVIGIVITSLVLGGLLGLASRRFRIVLPLGLAGFGAVGAWALASDPLGSTDIALAAATISVGAGILTFEVLWRLARPAEEPVLLVDAEVAPDDTPGSHRRTFIDRRGFILASSGLVVGAVTTAALARRIRSSDVVDSARRTTVLPRPARSTLPPATQPFSVDGLSTYITPSDDFFRIDTALTTPLVDVGSWRLRIDGLVDRPIELTYDDLLGLESVEETVTIQCVSNEVGGRLVGTAVWQGVPLPALLDRVGVRPEATQIVGRSVDGWTAGFPTADALDGRTALVAYAMNGAPLPTDHGFPARLIVSGLYGYVSATKWLEQIELTTWEAFDGYWVPRGWSKRGPIKIASRIDVPRSSGQLAAGPQPIAGVAWAPDRGITSVEVQVDDGAWLPCELGRTASDDTWVQWRHVWDATPGNHTIRVRATDGTGTVQTGEPSAPAPDGATGWHRRSVRVA